VPVEGDTAPVAAAGTAPAAAGTVPVVGGTGQPGDNLVPAEGTAVVADTAAAAGTASEQTQAPQNSASSVGTVETFPAIWRVNMSTMLSFPFQADGSRSDAVAADRPH
jgi:hypothetical protein